MLDVLNITSNKCECGKGVKYYTCIHNNAKRVLCLREISQIIMSPYSFTLDFIKSSIEQNKVKMENEIDLAISDIYDDCKEMISKAQIKGVTPYKIKGYVGNVLQMIEIRNRIQNQYL